MEEIKCTSCGFIGEVKLIEVYEDSDADGNRGRWVVYAQCPSCKKDVENEDIYCEEEEEECLRSA